MNGPLIDCHLHLQEPVLMSHLTAVLEHAAAAGVRRLVCNGATEADWPIVAQLAREHPEVGMALT